MNQIRAIRSNPRNLEGSNPRNQPKSVQSFYEDNDGILNISQIFNENGPTSNYFISGPPAMIKTFKQTLIEKGVPTENVLTDDRE